jgi:integrase
MAAPMVKTKHQGIFKRGSRYVVVFYVDGRQRKEAVRTLDEARRLKARREADVERGEFHARSRATLREYALGWVERYQGRGRRGFRDSTREDYRRMLTQYPLGYFPERTRLTEITPMRIAEFVAWLCEQTKPAPTKDHPGRREPLSDKTIRNVIGPLRACLATAVREGLIRSNPARDIDLPHRPTAEDTEDEEVRVMNEEELRALLKQFPEQWWLFFWFLAATGLRISEAIAVQWRHLQLDGSTPHVKVRRGVVRGKLGPPKSRHARRDVPLPSGLVRAMGAPEGDGASRRRRSGVPSEQRCVPARREPPPSRAQAGQRRGRCRVGRVPHVPAHLRVSAVRRGPQRRSGAALARPPLGGLYALTTYVHLLDGDLGKPLDFAEDPSEGGNKVATDPTGSGSTPPESDLAEAA